MGKATLAKQRAARLIGQGRVEKLYDEGKLMLVFADDQARLLERLATLERANALLREIVADTTETSVLAAQVLKEAMGR